MWLFIPYLSILAMEYLITLISTHVNQNFWKSFKLNNSNLKTFHLLFTNDVLLFSKANDQSIATIKMVLEDFCLVSGVEINFEKSKLWLSPIYFRQ